MTMDTPNSNIKQSVYSINNHDGYDEFQVCSFFTILVYTHSHTYKQCFQYIDKTMAPHFGSFKIHSHNLKMTHEFFWLYFLWPLAVK